MKAFSRLILRFSGIIVLIGTALAVLGAYYSFHLYQNLRPDLEELLPSTARSVMDLDEVTTRLEAIDNLAILIFSKHPDATRRFVDHLSAKLSKAPKDTIASVEYRIDREIKFFKARRALYLDLKDLLKVRDYIHDRIEYEKELYNPLNIFSGQEIPEPRLDFKALRQKYENKTATYDRFPDGYYATPDGTKRVILVYAPGKVSSIKTIQQLKDFVTRSIEELQPQSYATDIEIKYTGGVQMMLEEQTALIADLGKSSIIVMVLVSAAMFFYFRAIRATFALLASLFIGTLWTFGIAYFAVGYLNANSAFLGSIIIGNGINFGIIYLARYLEERRNGLGHARSALIAMTKTSSATWTAAMAAGLSYGSLILTGFRGFKQFGIIGLIGMTLCWISSFTVLPALLCLLEGKKQPLARPILTYSKSHIPTWVANFISRFARPIWAVSVAISVLSLAAFTRLDSSILEDNLAKLRNKTSLEKGAAYLSTHVDEIFQRYLAPMVILANTRDEAREIALRLKTKKEREGKSSLIASVQTLEDFIPQDQPEKIKVLREIKQMLPQRFLRRLSPEDRKLVNEFLKKEVFRPVRTSDLPALVLNKFTEKDGSIGKLVLVEPPLTNFSLKKEETLRFIRELREVADAASTGAPVAGSMPITADMMESISREGPKMTFLAFLAVVLLVILLFRNIRTAGVVLFSLILGVLWLAGIILGTGIKINFLNFIAFPITFGIGVDYGVNIFQRYRQEGSGSLLRVIRNTGGAVALCSFTTIVGYSSLLIAENQAFVSFGLLSVLGEITCIIAATISLPAFLILQSKRAKSS